MRRPTSALLAAVLCATGLLLAPSAPAAADGDSLRATVAERPRDAGVHVVDGEVRSVAQVGSTVVLGGSFTEVGPVTRGAVGVVDTGSGSFRADFPDVVGRVAALAPDGAGGWYVGGAFTTVGGLPRRNLAHVDAEGTVTGFAPEPNGVVHALVARPGGGVVVGGEFTSLAAGTGRGLAALAADGSAVWRGTVTGAVRSLALSDDGATVYLGGSFSAVAGVSSRRLAAVDAQTGVRRAAFAPGVVNNTVNALAVHADSVLLGGDFTSVAGAARTRLAAVDAVTGTLGTLSVSVNNSVRALQVSAAGDVVYLGGSFGMVAGASRARLAGIDLTTGAVTSLTVPALTGTVAALAPTADGTGLYVAGPLQVTPEKDRPARLARVDLTSNAVSAVVPYPQTPRSLARSPLTGTSGPAVLALDGSDLVVGGDFSDYGTRTQPYLAAYDLATGALSDTFTPTPDAPVLTVKGSTDGSAVFVGGEFTSIDAHPAARIAKLSLADGTPAPGFSAGANSSVKDLAVGLDGASVYVGGNFAQFNGAPTSRLVRIDATTGASDPTFSMDLTEPTNDSGEGGLRAMALSPDGSTLMVIGNFRRIGGQLRPLIAQIDVSVSPAAITDWRTDVYDQPCSRGGKIGWMRDVDISPDGQRLYVVSSGHFYYPACDTANAFPMAAAGVDPVAPLWSKRIGDTIEAVAADQDTVYLGGHFKYLDTETHSEPRFQLAALDPQTGAGLNWIPNAGGFRGVLTLEVEPAGLFAGSDGDAFGGANHGRTAFWPQPAPGLEVRKDGDRRWSVRPGGSPVWTIRVRNTTAGPVELTALTDTVIGPLDGAGTCSLPQTVQAGESYACTVGRAVTGAAGTEVNTGTVTATATTAAGATVQDSDTAHYTITFGEPRLRTRVSAQGTVTFPGETVAFALTTMNLDPVRELVVDALASPTYGDLGAECGLPRTLAPNAMFTCRLELPVAGPVGSKPATTFTTTATADGDTLTSSASQTISVAPPVGGSKLVLVVANPAAPSASDLKLRDRLDALYSVTLADDTTVAPQDVTADVSAVVIGPSTVGTALGGRLNELATPVLVTPGGVLDELGMTAPGANGSVSGVTSWTIVQGMHPLSTARSGVQAINSVAQSVSWGEPAPSAAVISRLAAGGATGFAYRTGDLMAAAPAPACRTFFAAGNPTKFTTTAWTLFDRAVAYTVFGCGQNMLWTAAGNGTTTWAGEGTASVATGLGSPWGIAIDATGAVYVADTTNHRIRRIDPDGTMTTVAGTGVAGFSGDGGPATAARLNQPVRLTFGPDGGLYVADSTNHRIRRIDPDGTIGTVAGTGVAGFSGDGGPATAARLRSPYDVAFAPDGTMYVADRANHRVRAVTPGGTISTVAGTGVAGYSGDDVPATTSRLNNPYSVAVDAAGRLLVADFDNERVRLVEGGTITTFAGTGVPTADGDGGPATEAGLHKPQYVHVLPGGDVLISESNNNDVRVVHDGLIDTLAGSREFGYLGDGGSPQLSTWSRPSATALAPNGDLWIVDRNNKRLRVVSASSG